MSDPLDAVSKDVLKWVEKNRKEVNALKELESYRTDFLGNVSHELKTPIQSIQGYIHTLLDGALEDEKVNQLFLTKASNSTKRLIELVDECSCDLVLTTGGTGPAKRDVTPEATLSVGDKELPGFGEQMRQISLNFVPTAILSRQTAVIRNSSLIINLPGQPKAIRETLEGLRDSDGKNVVVAPQNIIVGNINIVNNISIHANQVISNDINNNDKISNYKFSKILNDQ